jgi:Flp pilus assembly CpaE family ATPase
LAAIALFERSLTTHANGIRLLAPPRALADVGYVTPEGVRHALTLGASLFPYVVMDVDHTFHAEQAQALRQADVILLVVRLDFICLRNDRRTLDYLTDLGVIAERVRLVVNRHGQAKEVPAAKAEQALGGKFSHYLPEDAATVNSANNNGIPAVFKSPTARFSRGMTQLAASLDGVKR